MDPQVAEVDMWRLRIARGNGKSGGGEWSYYESQAALESALFDAAAEAEAFTQSRTLEAGETAHRWRKWRKMKGAPDKEYGDYVVQRIVAVEHLVDCRWVDIDWSITDPELVLHETMKEST